MRSMKNTNLLASCEMELIGLFKNVPANTTDIMLNPNGTCFFETSSGSSGQLRICASEKTLLRLATVLASFTNQNLNDSSPCISCMLPATKYRAEVLVPPATNGICIAIRIPNRSFYNLEQLEERQMIDRNQRQHLEQLVRERKTIAISGQTGSGKTTLLCALANAIPESERVLIIEDDTREIEINRKNCVSIVSKKGIITGREAVRSALRMNPDRIIYGETRDGESALELLKAFRTGHSGGMFTIHASNASQVLRRLEDLLMEVTNSNGASLVASTIDAVAHLGFNENGSRVVREIITL